ncbi:MAG: hypothetical protein ACJLS3_12310 [Erythrobacter sp.]
MRKADAIINYFDRHDYSLSIWKIRADNHIDNSNFNHDLHHVCAFLFNIYQFDCKKLCRGRRSRAILHGAGRAGVMPA